METKEDYEVAKTVAKYKSRARNLYRLMCDGNWYTMEQLRILTGMACLRQAISAFRKDGIKFETQCLKNPRLTASERWRYRLVSIVSDELIDRAFEELQSFKYPGEKRCGEWLIGARKGVKAAKIDKELGVTRENPYQMVRGSRKSGWNIAYQTFMETGENVLHRFGEGKADVQQEKANKMPMTKSSYMKDAMIDWEFQAKGMTCASTHGSNRIYRIDPTLTEEDKAWAATQAMICRRELHRFTGRPLRQEEL